MLPKIQLHCLATVIFFWTATGVIIHNCDNKIRIVRENTPVVLSCGEIAETDTNTWCDSNMNTIASCSSAGRCLKYTKLDYQFTRNSTSSRLVIPQGLNHSQPRQSFTCMTNGTKYTCQLVVQKIPLTICPETIDTKVNGTSLGYLEPFKVALIVVASVIAAGLLVTVIIALIKRKGNIYHQTTQMNDEHPYTIVFTGQHANPFARSVQENELQPVQHPTTCHSTFFIHVSSPPCC